MMVTIELVLLVSIVAFVTSITSLGAYSYILNNHKLKILEIYNRLNYLEAGMHYHGLTPRPWELEDIENYLVKTKNFKQEGNVVYLQKEE